MTNLLVHKFVKNYDDINDPVVRRNYGTLSSLVGIFCNIMLFVLKYIMGTLSGSISIISDAFNNLSDSAGCIVTLLGYKMASKPADKDHPFGHGRMEYLTALFIAVLILIVAFELLKNSVEKIIHPEKLVFSTVVLVSLIVSILVKLWMSFFNGKLGRKINSSVMLATSKDSRTDVIATSATCISILSALVTDL
ncbi:MAG: cation diffusion facilitator family transporter, partial [Oscillospiraceae bacterium]|nr:cation diffusion facilitator family transporter [Oscillospiraceae bacterium]